MNKFGALFSELATAKGRARANSPGREDAGLTAEQNEALFLPLEGNAVIRAGAGSGKTKLLVERAVRLLDAGIDPTRIALISFTRKSARQLQGRIAARLGRQVRLPVCATLHSLALRTCAKQGAVRLFADDDLPDIVAEVRAVLGPSGRDLSDKDIATLVGRHRELRAFHSTFGLAALHWMERLLEKGYEDFTSLIERAEPDEAGRFFHVLVDESQDLSPVQLAFIKRLCAPRASCWFVGDDDQSIFVFRGAGASTMESLSRDAAHAKQLTLNWRCGGAIVRASNRLMLHAQGRTPLVWRAARPTDGSVEHREFATAAEELVAAAEFVEASPHRIVLGRTHKQLQALREFGLPACTVHEAKGLEWAGVWVLGCNQGVFPHLMSSDEEERRLFYVAMTRAKDQLVLSSRRSASVSAKKGLVLSPFVRQALP